MDVDSVVVFNDLNLEYTSHPYYSHFMAMIERGRKVGCDLTWGLFEFNRWLEIIGPVPGDMKKPSVGRYDHSKGYVFDIAMNRWNFRWEELSENCREGSTRGGFVTGIAGKASIASQLEKGTHVSQTGKSAFHTGIAGKAAVASQLKKGTHNSQTGKTGVHSGVAQRASIASPNHNTKKDMPCPHCSFIGKIPGIWAHIKSHNKGL